MDVAVVHILVSTDALVAVVVVLAAPRALATNGNEVVIVERTNQRRGLCEPLLEVGQCLFGEGTRLVAYLPRHDGGVVGILHTRIAIGTRHDVADVVVEQGVSLLVRRKLAHSLHKGRIAHIVGTRLLALAGMLQIEAVAPTPLP